MKLVEISLCKFVNLDSICSMKVSRPPQVDEDVAIEIVTADGATHRSKKDFSAKVFDALFPGEKPS